LRKAVKFAGRSTELGVYENDTGVARAAVKIARQPAAA
jgi:hypothetical protein